MNYTASDILFRDTPLVDTYETENVAVDTEDEQLREFRAKLGLIDKVVETPHIEDVDILPTRTTMEERYFRDYTADTVAVAKSKMSTKQKIAVASFVAVTLVLILAVTLCSLSVVGAFSSMIATENALASSVADLEVLSAELTADNIQELFTRAELAGFVQMSSANTITYNKLETRPAQNYNVQTNWFDTLCDWVGGMFGGN